MKLAWMVCGGALLLSGCSDDDHPAPLSSRPLPECPNEGYAACDVRSSACQKQIMSLAACVYGSSAPPAVPISVLNEGQFRALLEDSFAQDDAEQEPRDALATQVMEDALHALGLVARGAFSDEGRVDSIVEMFIGVYLDAEQGIILVDRGRAQNSVDANMLLLHEGIHALQDADYALDTWIEPHVSRTDSLLAARSVTEGQATFYQLRAGAAMLGHNVAYVDFTGTFDTLRRDLVGVALGDASPYVASSATFPYGYGASLANLAYSARGQGFESALFEAPPPSTREVMRRALFADDSSYQEVEPLEHEAPTPTGTYALLDEDVLGAWVTQLMLNAHGITFDETWLGAISDHLWLYADDADNGAWLWQLETNDPDMLSRAVAQLRLSLPETVRVEEAGGRAYFAAGGTEAPQFLLDAGQAFLDAGEP